MGYKVQREVYIDLDEDHVLAFKVWARAQGMDYNQIEAVLKDAALAAAYMLDVGDEKALYLEIDKDSKQMAWLDYNFVDAEKIGFGPMDWSSNGEDTAVTKV